ncbi:MAG: polysaccharide biosynthesis/export family protein, partial [Elusimicrobiota bacterium]
MLLLFAAGCSLAPRAGSPKPRKPLVPQQEAQAEAEEAAIASLLQSVRRNKGEDYKISPADLLEITVYREKELSRTLRVSQQGTISFPLVGVLRIGGLSVIEAEKSI